MYPVQNKPFIQVIAFFLLLAGIILIPGCRQDHCDWQQQGRTLLDQNIAINAKLTSLNTSVDSLWDTVSIQLDQTIPADFPSTDRDIFIHARNAGHIRMFMSYKQLDAATQSLVNKAGVADSLLALQIQSVYSELQEFEKQKFHFLTEVEKENKALRKAFAEKFRIAEPSIPQ